MHTSSPRALVVEDDRSWQQILVEILTDVGMDVDVADGLPAALACLRAAPHRLAVVDLSLGGSDHRNQEGLAVLDAVRRHDPGCVALLLTGYATVELAVQALTQHGAFTCLRKETFRRAEFRDVVRRALAEAPPAAAEPPPAPGSPSLSPAASQPEGVPPRRGTALVVEDDAGWRALLTELLGELGYAVQVCRSYGEALGLLRRTTFALAVVDLSLASSLFPDDNADGFRLLAQTRRSGIPSLVVSGSAKPEDVERAFEEYGVVAYLEKQAFDRQALRQAIAQVEAVRQAAAGPLSELTEREKEVLQLLAQGLTNKEIAEALVITDNTVKRHLKSIFAKLGVSTRSAAVARALAAGVPSVPTSPPPPSAGEDSPSPKEV
ncbi:MAG: response regulator [Caldilineales bacterium]|nr:response regulator [Caldilineales bacterium]MDW8319189.1 response regulator [Anaerolineae bacterium]